METKVDRRHQFKYPEGYISYTTSSTFPVVVKVIGVVGIGELIDNFRNTLPVNKTARNEIGDAIQRTAELIYLLMIHGGYISHGGKTFIPLNETDGPKAIPRRGEKYSLVKSGAAYNLSYKLPGTDVRHRPSFFLEDVPFRLVPHVQRSFKRGLEGTRQPDTVRLPTSDMGIQTLISIARTYGFFK